LIYNLLQQPHYIHPAKTVKPIWFLSLEIVINPVQETRYVTMKVSSRNETPYIFRKSEKTNSILLNALKSYLFLSTMLINRVFGFRGDIIALGGFIHEDNERNRITLPRKRPSRQNFGSAHQTHQQPA
jgi:hypothetical protein